MIQLSSQWKHKKTKKKYVVTESATLKHTNEELDGAEVVIYVESGKQKKYVRLQSEFEESFEEIQPQW